jgi:hypothetical protein
MMIKINQKAVLIQGTNAKDYAKSHIKAIRHKHLKAVISILVVTVTTTTAAADITKEENAACCCCCFLFFWMGSQVTRCKILRAGMGCSGFMIFC